MRRDLFCQYEPLPTLYSLALRHQVPGERNEAGARCVHVKILMPKLALAAPAKAGRRVCFTRNEFLSEEGEPARVAPNILLARGYA